MKNCYATWPLGALFLIALRATSVSAQTPGIVLVRHAPTLNGTIQGSIQQMTAESVTLNSGAAVTGDLLVPGTPTVRLNGKPVFGGTLPGSGVTTPSNYTVTLNGNVSLGHLRTQTDAVAMPSVAAPPAPTGTRSVAINKSSDSLGDFSTLRNLTLNGNVGQVAVPAGIYGDFTANGHGGFTLGVTGATQPSVYAFQHLTLNGNTALQIVGPVVITLANGLTVNGAIGATTNPEWLKIQISAGDFTLNGNVSVHGYINTPSGAVTVNGNSQLVGGVIADRLTLNGNSVLQALNLSPKVDLSAPVDGTIQTAPIGALTLGATASDPDGYIAKVEFFAGATKLGQTTTAPFQFVWANIPAGTYLITAKATDDAGSSTTSTPVTLIANAPPTVALNAPTNHAVFAAPGTFTLEASAADFDGIIAKVEFFNGAAKLGEAATAPYQLALSNLVAGNYTFTAKATDNNGATALSANLGVVVEVSPTAALTAPPIVNRGDSVTLTATAADTDGSIAKVEFYRNSTLIGTVITPTGSPPAYVFTDTGSLTPGGYSYTVRSYDNLGLFTDSSISAVVVLATLPYTADFEPTEGYTLGPIAGQLGWTASPGTATVTSDAVFNGLHSIALTPGTPPVRVAQAFAPFPGHDVVFMDFFARPVAETDLTNSTTFDIEGARFAFGKNGSTGVLNAFNGDGVGDGTWQSTAFSAPLGADNQLQTWTRLTARLDFTHKTWDLYVAGNMVAADVQFRDNTATYLSSFAIRGDAATVSRLDYLLAGAENPLFADVNNNGIDDAWETAHGLSLTTNNRTLSPSGNGVTVVQAYVARSDPNDFYNGAVPTITSLVPSDGSIGANGAISVRVTKADGTVLTNAPISFAVISSGSTISAVPAGTQSAQQSIRTDASGVATVYVALNGATAATLNASARSGAQAATISISVNLGIIDADRNGLPDDWEIKYFGHVGVDPNGDYDGDGVTNLQEYKNGTDPTDFYNGVLPIHDTLNGGREGANGELALVVRHPDGTVWPNAPVTFNVSSGFRGISAASGGPYQSSVQVLAGADGVAQVFLEPLAP